MAPNASAKDHPWEYFTASAAAAAINYPLWRASATAQSGFNMATVSLTTSGSSSASATASSSAANSLPEGVAHFVHAFRPPYRGMLATVAGMTWARAAIFWTSDMGKEILLKDYNCDMATATILPPFIVSTIVQIVNMPLVRATITIQDPNSKLPHVRAALGDIYRTRGVAGLWHGTSAGILKTVPKYITAIAVKDYMEANLPPVENPADHPQQVLLRSACKSATAGVAGAFLTNPLDVIRNSMFRTNQNLVPTVKALMKEDGLKFMTKGLGKNIVAVAVPVGCTIFFTDALLQYNSN